MRSLEEIQKRLGYRFRDPERLDRALTHSSYANEMGNRSQHLACNERLEFLGDAILSAVSSEYLYRRYPNLPEGDLTRMRSAIVCEEALANYAASLDLGAYLLLGKGEQNNGGASKPAILADTFEAVLAAIYTDAQPDPMHAAADFAIPFLQKELESLPAFGKDSKSRLQELIQKDGPASPDYRIVREEGPDHAKTYEVEVYLDSNCIGKGCGTSKRHAEQEAAADALRLFGVDR